MGIYVDGVAAAVLLGVVFGLFYLLNRGVDRLLEWLGERPIVASATESCFGCVAGPVFMILGLAMAFGLLFAFVQLIKWMWNATP